MTKDQDRLLKQASALSWHLYEEADRALQSWAAVQQTKRYNAVVLQSATANQFRNLDVGQAYQQTVNACLRDTLMTLCRMTDPPNQSPLSLFQIPLLLNNPELRAAINNDWRWNCPSGAKNKIVLSHQRLLEKLVPEFDKNVKVSTWKESEVVFQNPINILKCRAELKRFRDAIIAHANDKSELGGLTSSELT